MTQVIEDELFSFPQEYPNLLSVEDPHLAEDFVARLLLSQLVEPGDPVVGRAVADLGAPTVFRHFRSLEQTAQSPFGQVRCKLPSRWNTDHARELAYREAEAAERHGVKFVFPSTAGWPTQLADLRPREPLMLRVRGSVGVRELAARGIGVVGARACTRYGQDTTEDLASRLASNDWTIISGGAYGIDAAAHRGALAAGGLTIAVSAAGVDQAVPASNSALFEAVAQNGAVVSEAPLGAHPTRSRFLVRNRLIAALARGVVVTEAALRSGSLSTAREASQIGRILMAVPGPVTSLSSAGGHDLIREGMATLVTGHTDVVNLMKVVGGDLGDEHPTHLDHEILQVLAGALPGAVGGDTGTGLGIDQIAEVLERDVAEVLVGLCSLESRQKVDRTPMGWVRVSKRRN